MKTNDLEDFEAEYVNPEDKSKKSRTLLILIIGILIIIIIVLIIIRLLSKNKIDMVKEYDFYNFAFQNPRIFCYSKREGIKECLDKTKQFQNNKFTIHGMWPSILNKLVKDIKDCSCNTGKTIEVKIDKYKDFYETKMKKLWPSSTQKYESFWTHEYNKHGYCFNKRFNHSTDNYTYYFEKTIDLFEKLNLTNLLEIISPEKSKELTFEYNKTEFINLVQNKTGIIPYVFCANYNNTQMVYEIQIALSLNFSYIRNDNLVKEVPEACNDNSKIVFKFD